MSSTSPQTAIVGNIRVDLRRVVLVLVVQLGSLDRSGEGGVLLPVVGGRLPLDTDESTMTHDDRHKGQRSHDRTARREAPRGRHPSAT